MVSVLIADDHAAVRAGYRQFLQADSIVTDICEVANGGETIDALRTRDWDLLLMDINMPDHGGLDILQRVTADYPAVRVLIMSGLPEEQYARNVLRAGACGYVSKGGSPEEFLKAVHLVLKGRRYVSGALAESMAADLENNRASDQPLHSSLSTREFQIFLKLAIGRGVGNIAAELSLSVKTVSTYRSRILEKMAFKSNADMTGYALRNGLMH